ncbi:MAG: SHOCT domain-containing protein, partial [Comamonadaceae bacterium]|nr:SHOCT domain-containing protein [Comamonadaceae bacterium]
SISLPDELQKVLDQKIGMGMVGGDMSRLMQYQSAQAITQMAEGAATNGGLASAGLGMGAGIAMGQMLTQAMHPGLPGNAPAAPPATVAAPEVLATLEKLGELKDRGILTDEEFSAKKAELLKKLC